MEFRDDYSFEQLLYKIEVSQSRVCEMKDRLDILMEENEERIASAENIILPESNNGLVTCPIRESDFPTNMEGPSIVADLSSQLIKFNTANNLIKSEAIASSQGEGTHLQDANGPMEQPIIASRKRVSVYVFYCFSLHRALTISAHLLMNALIWAMFLCLRVQRAIIIKLNWDG